MAVGVDGEAAAEVAGELEQLGGRVASLGPGVDLDRDVVLGAGLEDRPRVELRLPGRVPRLPVTSRPVQWPSTLVRGFRIAPIIRRVIASGVHLQLGVHARHPDVELRQQLVALVEAPVVEDVDLDPLQQA